MIKTERPTLPAPHTIAPHRYQVYRQARNGLHHNHGESIASPAEAVIHFLHATPAFEGGGLHLWDRREQRSVASVEWNVEVTRFGFWVRTRANVFHDESLSTFARQITEREALEETIISGLRATI